MSQVEILRVRRALSVEEGNALAGKFLDNSSFDRLITSSVDVYDEETGAPLFKFRRRFIPENICSLAYRNLRAAATVSYNRGTASATSDDKKPRIQADGTLANTVEADPVRSGIVGYYDRYPRTPYCRLTAYTQKHFDRFRSAYPVIKLVDEAYQELFPEHYAKQRAVADRTSQDFVIKGTAFSTITVNRNYQTGVHKDAGDFPDGFGNLVVLTRGRYEGGYFVLPEWRIAIDARRGDLLLVDVHKWHGNTALVPYSKDAERLSLVMYFRENMIYCGTMEQELERAKHRKKGDRLNG